MRIIFERLRKIRKLLLILQPMNRLWIKGLFQGVAAGIEHEKVLRQLKPNYVVDIGANRGQFAMAVRGILPNAEIFSIEPLVEPAKVFNNIFRSDSNITLCNVALGSSPGTKSMYVSKSDDSSSLLPISSLQTVIFPGTGLNERVNVRVATLDEIIGKEDIPTRALLKLDVQGSELDALHGCSTLLSGFFWIYCECSFVELYSKQSLATDVIEWLYGKGFILKGLYNPFYDNSGVAIQADFLFENKNVDILR